MKLLNKLKKVIAFSIVIALIPVSANAWQWRDLLDSKIIGSFVVGTAAICLGYAYYKKIHRTIIQAQPRTPQAGNPQGQMRANNHNNQDNGNVERNRNLQNNGNTPGTVLQPPVSSSQQNHQTQQTSINTSAIGSSAPIPVTSQSTTINEKAKHDLLPPLSSLNPPAIGSSISEPAAPQWAVISEKTEHDLPPFFMPSNKVYELQLSGDKDLYISKRLSPPQTAAYITFPNGSKGTYTFQGDFWTLESGSDRNKKQINVKEYDDYLTRKHNERLENYKLEKYTTEKAHASSHSSAALQNPAVRKNSRRYKFEHGQASTRKQLKPVHSFQSQPADSQAVARRHILQSSLATSLLKKAQPQAQQKAKNAQNVPVISVSVSAQSPSIQSHTTLPRSQKASGQYERAVEPPRNGLAKYVKMRTQKKEHRLGLRKINKINRQRNADTPIAIYAIN